MKPGKIMARYIAGMALLTQLSKHYNVDIPSIRSTARFDYLVKIRREFCHRAYALGLGRIIIGKLLWRDPETVAYHMCPAMRARKELQRRRYQARKEVSRRSVGPPLEYLDNA